MAGAALSAGTLLASQGRAQSSSSERELSKDDVALLQFALWAEIVESDLWTQYAELGEQRKNPDLGAAFKGPFVITNQPAIPLNDTDTPPTTNPTIPITGRDAQRLQAIANTAGFHFAFIEQGGRASIRRWLSRQPIRPSCGSWSVLAEFVTGLTFPDLNNPATELTQTNKILPEPCNFISKSLPRCSVIRPTSTQNGGAVATVKAFTDDGLFIGQSAASLQLSMQLAIAADSVQRGF
jgi:hypothetical protein